MRLSSKLSGTALVVLCAAMGFATPAVADEPLPGGDPAPPPPPPAYNVRYTVTSDKPVIAEIYYRDTDPPTFSDYSHDPYVFSPNVEATVGPNKPWVLEATLTDPIQWSMVVVQATGAIPKAAAGFNCTLEINGQVVKRDSGPKGALCSLKNW
ncbi:hypothetical protein [Mycolicibacterium aichiense]|uniref:Secreted protein n=1 Tax=Mycolicibacterium aichiense TaxID=1799 RepID=A0AAD1MC39_9MYCO|nr:hypothetical protein [Mycolicibacterium aichiense]MCV7021740.1 hypothetical protein [Mycolicibacterium aichiense]BBX09017.1 hypothetical protein MAIC_38200 [Mycolicibacterium aichiense]STZ82808.1 putative secreted protein [Mycolicibacterium aichiense]